MRKFVSAITGIAAGVVLAAGLATESSANVVMALPFDEPEQPGAGQTPLPFQTADISGNGNHGWIYDGPGGQIALDGPAFPGCCPSFTNFEKEDGTGNGPAGPFGGGPGHYLGIFGDYVELTPPGSPGVTPNGDLSFGAGDFTVEYWFRTGEHTFSMLALDSAASPVRDTIRFFMEGGGNAGKIAVNLNSVESEGPHFLTSNAYNDNAWHHAAIVRNTATGMGHLHLDGGAANGGETIDRVVNSAWTWSEPYDFSYRINGTGDNAFRSIWQIDELRVSTIARSESQLGFHGTIVPEPASLALLLIGAGLLKVVRRRK
jgi:hypothetical protein